MGNLPGGGLADPGRANTVPGSGKGTGTRVVPTTKTKPTTTVPPRSSVPLPTAPGQPGGWTETPVNVQGLRAMLVKAGYNIPTTGGTAGPLFKAALRDYLQPTASHPVSQRILSLIGVNGQKGEVLPSGLRNPKQFNQEHGLLPGGKVTPPTRPPSSGPEATFDQNGVYVPENTDPTSTAQTTFDASGLDALNTVATKLGVNTPLMPTSLADKLAGLQYDQQIHDLGITAQRGTRDAAQSMRDIADWYQQVGAARAKSATQDAAASAAGQSSVANAVQGIIASLGGGANMGSGQVGAAGADQAGLLAALGANENQYQADLKPLLAAEGAGALRSQQATNVKNAQDVQQQIIDAEGNRGNAKGQALLNILGQNATIRGQNNTLAQQRWADQEQVARDKESAAIDGLNVQSKMAGLNSKAPKGSFDASSTADRINYANAVDTSLVDKTTRQPLPGMTRAKAVSIARRIARIYFPNGGIPNGTGFIATLVKNAGL